MKVAIIMSVYKHDRLDYFKLAVSSILNQTYNEFILFLCIDGPIGESMNEYVDELELYENVIVFKSKINRGLAGSLNSLIELVRLDGSFSYIARMDSDDISYPSRIENQVSFMNKNSEIDISGAYCNEFGSSIALDEKKVPLTHNDILQFSISRCPLIHPTVIVRKTVFNELIYPTNTHFSEDMSLWYNLILKGYTFGNLDIPVVKFRIDENTVSRRKGINKGLSEFTLRYNYLKKSNQLSFKNVSLISRKLILPILPKKVITLLYKKFR
ncbi:Glycosyl transferase [Vibrio chagasii]|uniref:glycosyltransferase n=1 Tax=Vibrio chagasii TaxID=170679 RepID=UPI0033743CC7|nr:Glycosyl transferase [Vibrio chagasii]CAH6933399.1 Glycosyl transferase [Vibrio chagasii]CAH7037328.1 Glycosyl transferase [Vibrio chagasii]CAH7062605.1 Glycosyl transferase [Vibrio chagasii]CAH7090237.1 Glycosyl transferase [Vibrio chagasii]